MSRVILSSLFLPDLCKHCCEVGVSVIATEPSTPPLPFAFSCPILICVTVVCGVCVFIRIHVCVLGPSGNRPGEVTDSACC